MGVGGRSHGVLSAAGRDVAQSAGRFPVREGRPTGDTSAGATVLEDIGLENNVPVPRTAMQTPVSVPREKEDSFPSLNSFLPSVGDHVLTKGWEMPDSPDEDSGEEEAGSDTSSCLKMAKTKHSVKMTWLAVVKEVRGDGPGLASGTVLYASEGFASGTHPGIDSQWDVFEGEKRDVRFTVTCRDGIPSRTLVENEEHRGLPLQWNVVDVENLRRRFAVNEEISLRCDKLERGLSEVRAALCSLATRFDGFMAQEGAREDRTLSPYSEDPRRRSSSSGVQETKPASVEFLHAFLSLEYDRVIRKSRPFNDSIQQSELPLGDGRGLDIVTSSTLFFPSDKITEGVHCTKKQFKDICIAFKVKFTTGSQNRNEWHGRDWQATMRPSEYSFDWADSGEEFALQFSSYGTFCEAVGVTHQQRLVRLWSQHLEKRPIPSACFVGSVIVIGPKDAEDVDADVKHERLLLLGHSWKGLLKRYQNGARDHHVWCLRQEDIRYQAGAGRCNSVFIRTRTTVSELMRLRDKSKIIAEDCESPMEIVWRPDSRCAKAVVSSDYAPGLLAFSVPVVFVRSADLMKSVTHVCDKDAVGQTWSTREEVRRHREQVDKVVEEVVRPPAFTSVASPCEERT